ncbi:hypothetical protein [Flavobacterium sp.]|uniref:hypothetical protein n=1 Tax=Flavobacterium sp. TaxID=239 RepID=UPI0011FA5479|nr:hypothetical protein [Flavobacterium sp.]RZJ70416.1 MAG: hypothetical protein EOO49_14140 [Flavobacterium sp.]
MSIENFFSDFEKQGKESEERKKLILEAKEKEAAKEQAFLDDYKNYYAQTLKPELEKIGEKLSSKFEVEIDEEPTIAQGRHYYSKIKLVPKFDNYVKKVSISLTAESGRELITMSGEYDNAKGQSNNEGIYGFQEDVPTFKQLNIEEQISKILGQVFIKK